MRAACAGRTRLTLEAHGKDLVVVDLELEVLDLGRAEGCEQVLHDSGSLKEARRGC